jgi:hypothetical protein
MNKKIYTLSLGLLLMGALVVFLAGFFARDGLPGSLESKVSLAQVAQNQPQQSNAVELSGAYDGLVKLNGVVGGVFSDTLAAPTAPITNGVGLGDIDLALQLTQTGNALSGYVSLDKTLVFSVEHTLGSGAASVKIGPFVNGSAADANFTLQSERVAMLVSGRTAQRQFRLIGASSTGNGSVIKGEYRETLWGYTAVPVTVIGTFTLQRPVFGSGVPGPSNQPPNVVADTATTTQGTPITINVLANDSAANGGALTITSVSQPQFGTATTDGQTVTYMPNANFVGNDTFSYVISDGQGGVATGSVSITVTGSGSANRPPTAANDTATTTAGNAVTIDVLANDADPDGDALTLTIDGPPSHGAATVSKGKVIYTPQAGFTGTDSFTYIVSDGKGGTATGSVSVTVTSQPGSGSSTLHLPIIRR